MEIQKHKLRIIEIIKETADAITIKFENLQPKIHYKSGQFITLILNIKGTEVRRSYSISSSPYTENEISICVKAVDKGLVSNQIISTFKVGDYVDILEPMGHFAVHPVATNTRHLIFFSAGSGITPLISIAKTILAQEPNSKISFINGNRDRSTIIYKKELEQLEHKYQERFNLIHVLSNPDQYWVGFTGRINQATAVNLIQKVAAITNRQCEYYLCGPLGMMEEVLKALDLLGVPKEKIHKENFHAVPLPTEVLEKGVSTGKSRVKIIDGKRTYEFEMDYKEHILETALKLGYNLPYSCQAGMCTACMGKCTNGKVVMDNPDGLTDNEIAKGYVLTCVGHPASEQVTIEL